MANRRAVILGANFAVDALILDQFSKWFVPEFIVGYGETLYLLPFLEFVLHHNRGISFGLFHTDAASSAWILSAGALIIVAVLVRWMLKTERVASAIALGLIVGGAVGNVVDRIRIGAVIDFIHVHYGWFDWPVFNLADTFIFIGAVFLIGESLFSWRRAPDNMAGR